MKLNRTAVGALTATATVALGAGAASAASPGERAERCEARLAKAAEKRGLTIEQLQATIENRLLARIDAVEQAGRISEARAARLRERLERSTVCGARRHAVVGFAVRGMVRAAAGFLGLDRAELRAQLPGTSLVALAERRGRTEAALEAAMVARAKERLAKAVAAGRLTQARADARAMRVEALADRLANRVFPTR